MVKLNKILLGTFVIATASLLLSCSSKDDDNGGGNNTNLVIPNQSIRDAVLNGAMKQTELYGIVHDNNGNPIAGVTVGSGTAVTTTDTSGTFALANIEVVKGRTVVDFKKNGYFTVVRSFTEADKDEWDVVMIGKDDATSATSESYNSTEKVTLETMDGMQVEMPADGYKNAETGKAYNGTVNTEMVYLSPDDDNFASMMPGGDLAAVRSDNSEVQLVSYGMTKVDMSDASGNKLQLQDGKEAELTFPVPESFEGKELPATIPLWSFNESTGLWEEEGLATLNDGVYVGSVKHFSWVNLDWPESRVTCVITVKTKTGKVVPRTLIHVGQTTAVTNAEGRAECFIPENTDVDICVKPQDYGNYSPEVSVHVNGVAGGGTVSKELILPDMATVKGKVVNKEGSSLSTIWIEYGLEETRKAHTDLDGTFAIMAPADYIGVATLKIRAANGEYFTKAIELTGDDLDLGNIDINAKIEYTEGGVILVTTDAGKTYELPVQVENKMENGAIIVDSMLMVISSTDMGTSEAMAEDEESGERMMWVFECDNFDSHKGTGTGSFLWELDSPQKMTMAFINNKAAFTTRISDNKLSMDMTGRGIFVNIESEDDYMQYATIDNEKGNASFVGSGLNFDILYHGTTVRPLTSKQMPAFGQKVFILSYPVGLLMQSKYFQKGSIGFQNGDYSRFNTLATNAQRLGLPLISSTDMAQGDDMYEAVYYANQKLVIVKYDPSIKWDAEAAQTGSAFGFDAPIELVVVEGIDPEFIDMVMNMGGFDESADEAVRAPRRAPRKLSVLDRLKQLLKPSKPTRKF